MWEGCKTRSRERHDAGGRERGSEGARKGLSRVHRAVEAFGDGARGNGVGEEASAELREYGGDGDVGDGRPTSQGERMMRRGERPLCVLLLLEALV